MRFAEVFTIAAVSWAVFPTLTSASPVPGNAEALFVRQSSKCDPGSPTSLTPSCWTDLEMDAYIRKWVTDNGGNCDNLGFAQCFLKFNKHPEMTCDIITEETCSPPDAAGNWDSPQQFLYYRAIGDAHTQALDKVGAIVLKIFPPHDEALADGRIIGILITASFGVFGVAKEFLGAFKSIWIGMTTLATSGAQLANYIASEGGNNFNQETVMIADMQSKLGDMILAYQTDIARMVKNIQGDSEKFLKLCSAGGFSQRISTSLPDSTTTIFDQLLIYILSVVLQENHIVISKSPKTNPQTVAQQTNKVHCPGFDQYGTCFQYFYDKPSDTTYTLTNLKDNAGNDYWDLTHTIWTQGWATPTSLYLGSEGCAGKEPYLDDDGKLQCVSNLRVCTAANEVFDMRDPSAEQFTDCPDADYWLADISRDYDYALCVPKSYLGPEIAHPTGMLALDRTGQDQSSVRNRHVRPGLVRMRTDGKNPSVREQAGDGAIFLRLDGDKRKGRPSTEKS
ncbi:hypothetical protein BDD12DRAFT_911049 [Trichophaea hybrida]|nr:hypothetical protein BDD12DRAFT_911049 [Trichophaea hybrida]